MQYEITVKSTPEARYDGSLDGEVRDALCSVGLGVVYDEGGVSNFENIEEAAENHFGIEVTDEPTARRAALVVANRMKRPVSFYRYGNDGDAETPRFIVKPGDLPVV